MDVPATRISAPGADDIRHIVRTDSPIDFNPERMIIALSNSF